MPATSEFRHGTKPLIAALLGVALGASPIPYNTIGLVIGPIKAEYGWSVEQVTNGITIFGVIAALLAPLIGGLADHIGVRIVALWSLVAFILAFSLFYFTPANVYGWYAIWVLVGLVGIGSTPVTWSRGVSQWFVRNRGLALGIMLLGTSISAIFVPRIGTLVIENWGWRAVFPAFAGLTLLIALPLGILWFREPRDHERPKGLTDATGKLIGATLKEAMRTRSFWILVASTILISTAYGGAHVHMVQIVQRHGFDAMQAAGVASVVGIGILLGRVIVGLLFDRFWAPAVAFPVLILPAISCWLLMGSSSDYLLLQVAGFLLGFAAGAESDVIAFLAARYFGMAHYGKIFGALYLFFGLCAGISPKLYGRVADVAGSYDPALQAAIVAFCAGGASLLLLGRYPPQYETRRDDGPAPSHL